MLVNLNDVLLDAKKGKYAVGLFNTVNLEMAKGVIGAAEELHSPVIIGTAEVLTCYSTIDELAYFLIPMAKKAKVPVVLHFDHGYTEDLIKKAIRYGFTSVMYDCSTMSFEDNIALTRKVVEYAHDHGVVVEAELGTLAGIEDEVNVSAEDSSYTRPEDVQEFVERTGCDSLAIAIGTSHGAYKFKPGTKPQLRFDILEDVERRLPGFPIVLHGASSVPQEFVKQINENGGNMPGAIGVPEAQLRQAASMAVCKINIDSDLRLAMTASIRSYLNAHPDHFDPRQYLKPARQAIKDMVAHKIVDVLGCNGKA